MKLKPYVLVGILFVLIFVVTVFMFQSCGVWDPPGNRGGDGHDDHDDDCDDETNIETEYKNESNNDEVILDNDVYISDSLEGSKNLLDFLKDNEIPVQCVSEAMNISESEMNANAGAIKSKYGMHMGDIRAIIDVCLGLEPREDDHGEEDYDDTTTIESSDKSETEHSVSTEDDAGDEKPQPVKQAEEKEEPPKVVEEEHEPGQGQNTEKDGIGKGQGGEGKGSGDGAGNNLSSDLPKLVGSDNISEYCEKNNIPKSCVAEKLNVSEGELDSGGGELSNKLGMKMYELREIVLSCS